MPESSLRWIDVDGNLAILDRHIDRGCSYLVREPRPVAPVILTPRLIRIHGDLLCLGGLVIHVDNYYRRDAQDRIHGFVYRYHAQFAERPLRQIFRYDNDHIYTREGHPDAFHKHVFNDRTWKEAEVVHIGQDHFPSLMEVIDELYDWWLRKRDDPLIYP